MNNPAEDEASLLLKVSDLHLTNEPWSPDETISSTLKYFADKGDIQVSCKFLGWLACNNRFYSSQLSPSTW